MIVLLQTQINIVLSILLSILLIHAYFNINRKKVTNKLIICIMGLVCFSLLLETVSILLNNEDLKQFVVLHKLVNIIGFMMAPVILFIGSIFNKEWINRYQKEKLVVNKILLIPLIINGVAALISYNKNGVFHVTSQNLYERGPLFFITPCVTYIFFSYNLYIIYKHREKLTYSEFCTLSLLYIVPAIFTSIQLRYSIYLTAWNSAAIIIVISYIFILNDQAYRDTLTGLQNRLAYDHYSQNISQKKLKKLNIVYIDIDDFKAINDRYGHCEGDEAIKVFAYLLRESFQLRQKKLIRLGGDEFLIIIENQPTENVTAYIESLVQNFEDYNNRGEKPYRLSFSYGRSCYTKPVKNICQLLECADKSMYEQKQNKKSKI
ncbi:GGDEF domain-containing protein [Clostridium vincentii]|uniref:Putative diguanylate cyclase YcdT n=1 Tax=Clostridium vincentii TaxID=52704 RepID=A0A2T0BFH6_9CLOT|nr:GGDEF domain-containing protein [Clostridium vincentii]PRR82618.1 putative diguanylate cyclase YcdT [Clostridium vincentii]